MVTPWVMELTARRIDEQREVGMTVDVDKPGGDGESFGPDDFDVLFTRQVSDIDDATAGNRYVRLERRLAGPVDHRPAADNEIGPHHFFPPSAGFRRRLRVVASWSIRSLFSGSLRMTTP